MEWKGANILAPYFFVSKIEHLFYLTKENFMYEIDPKYQGKINRMKNLAMFKGKSDAEILEHILRKEGEKRVKAVPLREDTSSYASRYKRLIDKLQSEYGVDINESNDTEALKLLVKHTLQLETLDLQIRNLQEKEIMTNEDTRTFKNLSDVQRSLVSSITELQDRLGISRKARKERQIDDIPQFIEALKSKAIDFWERKTIQIRCEKCQIELARYWLNFPHLGANISMELECQRCKEKIIHVR